MNGDAHSSDAPEEVAGIVRRLARYVRVNPLAGDNKEGITQWWLGMTAGSTDLVEKALNALEAMGVMAATRAADGQVRYRRASLDAAADAQLDYLISLRMDSRNE